MTSKTLTLNEIEQTQLKEILQSVLTKQLRLTVQLPGGEEVIIQPKPSLKPLPVLKGCVPADWKEAIY